MRRGTQITTISAWLAIGLSCILVVPTLPFRSTLPAVVLLLLLIVQFRFSITSAYALFWMMGCVLTATPGEHNDVALVLLFTGLILFAPSAASGMRQACITPFQRTDIGIIAATVACMLILLASSLAAHPPHADTRLIIMTLLAGGVTLWFAVRETGETSGTTMRHFQCILFSVVTLLSLCSTIGLLATTGLAKVHARRGNDPCSLHWEQISEQLATRLELKGAIVSSLRRQVTLAEATTNTVLKRAILHTLVGHIYDESAWRWLMNDSITRNRKAAALDAFMNLKNGAVSPHEASTLLEVAVADVHLPATFKCWRILGDQMPKISLPAEALLDTGRDFFFEGKLSFSEYCLKQGLESKPGEWDAVRNLCHIYISEARFDEADALIKAYPLHPLHARETAFLTSKIAKFRASKADSNLPDSDAVHARFGDSLELLDVGMDFNPGRIGSETSLRFRWKAIAPVNPHWKVFVHVREQIYEGFFFQSDHRFVDVGFSPKARELGTPFAYDLKIQIPTNAPTGNYTVLVGIWNGQKRIRVTPPHPTINSRIIADDQLEIGKLIIQ